VWAAAAVLAIPVLAIAWYLFSPLFLDKEVNEEFPFAATAELPAGSCVLRLENLDVTNGPDLHVYISPVASPEGRDEVSAPGSETVGRLKGNIGNQNYEVPADYEIPADGSVVIYCKRFHVLFSIATLSPTA